MLVPVVLGVGMLGVPVRSWFSLPLASAFNERGRDIVTCAENDRPRRRPVLGSNGPFGEFVSGSTDFDFVSLVRLAFVRSQRRW